MNSVRCAGEVEGQRGAVPQASKRHGVDRSALKASQHIARKGRVDPKITTSRHYLGAAKNGYIVEVVLLSGSEVRNQFGDIGAFWPAINVSRPTFQLALWMLTWRRY